MPPRCLLAHPNFQEKKKREKKLPVLYCHTCPIKFIKNILKTQARFRTNLIALHHIAQQQVMVF